MAAKDRRLVLVAAAATVVVAGSVDWAQRTIGRSSQHGAASSGAVAAGALSGTWHVHTFYLVVAANGTGSFRWPIHFRCGTAPGESPPPCDTWTPATLTLPGGGSSPVEEIHDGGQARLRITERSGRSATGIVTSSTEPASMPDGPIDLRLAANDVLYLTPHTTPAGPSPKYLCGPAARGVNCGA